MQGRVSCVKAVFTSSSRRSQDTRKFQIGAEEYLRWYGMLMHAFETRVVPLPIQRYHTSIWWHAGQSQEKAPHSIIALVLSTEQSVQFADPEKTNNGY